MKPPAARARGWLILGLINGVSAVVGSFEALHGDVLSMVATWGAIGLATLCAFNAVQK